MTECDLKDDKTYLVMLVGLTVGLGALISTILAIIFAYKWHKQLDEESRSKTVPKLIYLSVVLLSFERVMRGVEVTLWYTAPRVITLICYHTNNFISFTGIFGSLGLFLTMKLSKSFTGSIYEISKREKNILYSLVFAIVFSTNLFLLLNGISAVKFSGIGQIILFLLAISMLAFSLILLYKVDAGFAQRLRALVVSNTVSDHRENSRMTHTGTENSSNIPRFSDYNSNTSMNKSSIIAEDIAMDHDNHLTDNQPNPMMQGSLDEVQSQSSFASIRTARITEYKNRHQRILKTAAKSMNSAIWITIAYLIMFAAGLLFAMGQCSSLSVAIGHGLLVISHPIIALSLSFSLPHSTKEYKHCCSPCDDWLQRIVVFQTSQEVIKKEMSQH